MLSRQTVDEKSSISETREGRGGGGGGGDGHFSCYWLDYLSGSTVKIFYKYTKFSKWNKQFFPKNILCVKGAKVIQIAVPKKGKEIKINWVIGNSDF